MAQQVTIPDEWVEFVARRVQEGGYADSGEVVAEALADLVAREDVEWTDGLTEREREELRESIIQVDGEADAEVARGHRLWWLIRKGIWMSCWGKCGRSGRGDSDGGTVFGTGAAGRREMLELLGRAGI